MRIYDISQRLPDCEAYPGDPKPEISSICSIEGGALYNLTAFSMCAHNGTHVDAPRHFINEGNAVDEIPLVKTIGKAYVVECKGVIDGKIAFDLVNRARSVSNESAFRLLVKGGGVLTESGARMIADAGVYLVGSETQSVGDENAPMAVHKILLEREIVLLEGIRLDGIEEGECFLCAAPISIRGADGAPCRAVLIRFDGN